MEGFSLKQNCKKSYDVVEFSPKGHFCTLSVGIFLVWFSDFSEDI